MSYESDLSRVPEHLQGGILRYIAHGIPPGSFLTAVLSNDLREALARADLTSRHHLFEVVYFLYNHAPVACWGDEERVAAWIARHREPA